MPINVLKTNDFFNDDNFRFQQGELVFSERELPLGWHDQIEIIRILQGEGEFTIAGKLHRVRAGSYVIINPNQIHSAVSHIGRPLIYQSLKFRYTYFDSISSDEVYKRYVLPLQNGTSYLPSSIISSFPIHSKVSDLFNELDETLSEEKPGFEIKTKMILYSLLYLFYENRFVYKKAETSIKKKSAETLVKETINYIHERYFEDFSLDLLATTLDTSKPHLCRTFKRWTNQTITEYQNNHRIKIACNRLIDSDDQIATIAFDLGYRNISYFHARFKKKTQITPNEYRDIYKRG